MKEVSSELKWVQLYQNLHSLFSCIGYQESTKFNLDKIVLEEILKNKDPQVIRHLLIHADDAPMTPHISMESLFKGIVEHVKDFYN